jgi:glycosyltransferase involved in cell wall biosynthesis
VDFEVILIDDGSESSPPAASLLDDPRVTVIRHETRSGVCAARNTGLRHARAEWIAFLDDDDMWAPRKLISVITAVRRARADFGYSSAVVLDRDWRPIEIARALPPDRLHEALRHGNLVPAGASNVVAKASLLRQMGGFDEEFWAMDWDMWFRMSRAGRGEAIEDVLVGYPEGSRLLSDEPLHREDCERMAAKHQEVSVDWGGYERWVADVSSRAGHRREAARHYLRSGIRYRDPKALVLAGAALFGPRAVERLRRVTPVEAPGWLSLYRDAA